MKIVIRPGVLNPRIYVVQPVSDSYEDIGAFDKVNLHSQDSYKAFKDLIASDETTLAQVQAEAEGQAIALNTGGEYAVTETSLLGRICPATGIDFATSMELANLAAMLEHIRNMRKGASVAIEDWIENPPAQGAQAKENERRKNRSTGQQNWPNN